MRAVAKMEPGPGGMRLIDAPVPAPGRGEVRIRVLTASICGTDMHIHRWDRWSEQRISLPRILGHEFVGEVDALGDGVHGLSPGDYVSAEGHMFCGRCTPCRRGQTHVCMRLRVLGVDMDGAFAEHVLVPASNVVAVSREVKEEYAAIQDPFGNAVHTVFSGDVPGRRVAVVGCGPIGLMTVSVARHIGAESIYAVESNPYRRELARRVGADLVLPPNDARERLMDATGGEGVDEVMEMSGVGEALDLGLKIVRPGGGLRILGIYDSSIELDITNDVVLKGVSITGVHGRRIFDTWDRMAGLLASGIDLDPIITHRFDLEEFEKGIGTMLTGRCGKVLLKVEH